MKTLSIVFIIVMIPVFCATSAFAFRCGSGLVSSGDTKTQVLVTCGKPTTKESTCEGRQTGTSIDKNGKIKKSGKCSNKVEVWHYNCGENDYIYALTFENGKLTDETTDGRGKGKSECLGK